MNLLNTRMVNACRADEAAFRAMNTLQIDPNADIVNIAIGLMTPAKMKELATKHLRRAMADAMRRPSRFGPESVAAKVLHTATQHMNTECALRFANAVFEASGIDTRNTVACPRLQTISLRYLQEAFPPSQIH